MANPERALRQLVARLPDMAPRDCEAILDSLSQAQRARVTALLRELDGERPVSSAAFDSTSVPPDLSPWLLDRLGVPQPDGVSAQAKREMTPHAVEALKTCVLELDRSVSQPTRGQSLLGLLRRNFVGRADESPGGAR